MPISPEDITCPNCGREGPEGFNPRRERDRIFITCGACGHEWERHTDKCPACGERALAPKRLPVLQKARGTQQSIIGYRMGRQCTSCGWSSGGTEETSAVF